MCNNRLSIISVPAVPNPWGSENGKKTRASGRPVNPISPTLWRLRSRLAKCESCCVGKYVPASPFAVILTN